MSEVDDFRQLMHATKTLSCSLDLDEQLPVIMDAALQLTNADRAVLVLVDKEGELQVRAERARPDAKADSGKYSRSVCQDVIRSGQPQFVLDVDMNMQLRDRKSISNLQLRTVMCSPLRSRTGMLGALYVHSTSPMRAFNEHKKEIFVALSDHCAIALDNAQLYAASISDPMTGLYNHSYCLRRLDEEIQRANRYGRCLSFVLIDLDNFKHVNDTYGHRTGDRLLGNVAAALRDHTRRVDVPVRYGGDEFAIILPDTSDPMTLAERVREAIAKVDVKDGDQCVSASIGVAIHPSDGKTEGQASNLIERADIAMYTSKKNGGNRVLQHLPESFVGGT